MISLINTQLQDKDVAIRIFDLGLKKYGDDPEYACAYVDFLSHLNEDNNTRVVFERVLTSNVMPADKQQFVFFPIPIKY